MQFPNVTHHVKSYLSNKPQLLQRYVQVGYSAAQYALVPINVLMKHLILVQGLDPNAVPGEKSRREFDQLLDSVFSGLHAHGFNNDYDFSWVNKKFEQTREQLSDLNLTREDFNRYTNVGNLQATQALDVEQVKEPFPPQKVFETVAGVPVTIDQNPLNELADLLSPTPDLQNVFDVSEKSGSLDEKIEKVKSAKKNFDNVSAETLKGALKNLVAYATELENTTGAEQRAEEVRKTVDYKRSLSDARKKAVMHDELENLKNEPTPDPEELFARTDYLKDVKDSLEKFGNGLGALGQRTDCKPRKINRVKTVPKSDSKTAAKEASGIQKLIEQGALDPSDVDSLVGEGLDKKSVEYWKKHHTPPVKITKKGAHKTTTVTKAEARRLTNEMVIRGLCQPDDEAVNAQIVENMKFDPTSFEALERVVQKHSLLLNQEALDPKFKGNFRRAPKPTKYCR